MLRVVEPRGQPDAPIRSRTVTPVAFVRLGSGAAGVRSY
jgi:hypothetical protein